MTLYGLPGTLGEHVPDPSPTAKAKAMLATRRYVLSCFQTHVQRTWYVVDRPRGTGDWSWSHSVADAVPQTHYWARRFAADMRRVMREGTLREVSA